MLPTGGRAFYWYGRVRANPRPVEFRIGGVDKVSLYEARLRAKQINADAAHGNDPAKALQQRKEKARHAMTVGQLWKSYRETHLVPKCSGHTLATDDSRYKHHLAKWASRPVASIERTDVADLHQSITASEVAEGRTGNAADKAVKLLRRMLTFAKVVPNPAGGKAVAFHGDSKRDRFLSLDELGRLSIALANAANTTIADALRFALLTGARRGNICRCRWADIHLDGALWTIPASESKNGRPLSIVLAPAAVELLKLRKRLRDPTSPWVFPGRRPENHIVELKTTWDKIRSEANLTDFRIHDLRHTLASHMAMSGASLLAIGKQLGHQNQQSTARYSHLEVNAIRPVTEAAVAAMFPDAANAAKRKGRKTPKRDDRA